MLMVRNSLEPGMGATRRLRKRLVRGWTSVWVPVVASGGTLILDRKLLKNELSIRIWPSVACDRSMPVLMPWMFARRIVPELTKPHRPLPAAAPLPTWTDSSMRRT
jgi:hypothetical protein